jgi:Uma2 family endonuclease
MVYWFQRGGCGFVAHSPLLKGPTMLMSAPPKVQTMADLLEQLGGISPARIRAQPGPGTATVKDVVTIERHENRLFELVDGTLVEKVMGYGESGIASLLVIAIGNFAAQEDLGVVTGEGGMFRFPENLVRIPDVAFVAWENLPNEQIPDDPVPAIVPDLAVEVLSASNTANEMSRKLREYFRVGVRLVWFVDPRTKSVTVYTSPKRFKVIDATGRLDGGKVLPGFELPVASLFGKVKRKKGTR